MARSRSYEQYRRDLKEGDRDAWLGQLVWYTVPEAISVDHPDLVAALKTVLLDDFVPKPPHDDDIFRRVCTQHQRKHVETSDPEVFENYLMRDVGRSGGKVTKQIVVEQVNANNKRLNYAPAVQLEYDKTTGLIDVTELDTAEDAEQALNLAELIVQNYKHERGHMNAFAIRALIRNVLVESSGTVVRPSGGIYFVNVFWADRVAALEKLGVEIGVTVHPIPLIDDKKQRAMLRKAFQSETVEEIDRMLGEIDSLLKGDEITQSRYVAMHERMKGITEKTSEYAELLEEEFGNAEFRMDIFEKKMKQLLNHVRT